MFRPHLSRIIIFLSLAIPLFFFSGCADDLRHRNIFDAGAGDAVMRFSVENVSLTRDGESEDIESVIDHAYLLFYAPDASLIADAPIAAVKAELDPDQAGNLIFKMPLSLSPNTDYQLIAIANADDYTPSGFEYFGEYLESWCHISSSDKDPLYLYSSSRISPQVSTNLPMKGGVIGDASFRFSLENGVYSIPASLSFRRMVARVDVANIVKEGFTVEGVALCNWRDAVPIPTFDSQLGNGFGALHSTLTDETASFDEPFIEMPEADDNGFQQLSKSLYCFPSVSYDAFIGDKVSTALIIKAKYGEDSESSYYRVNVGMTANQSKVSPNTKYLVTIRSVKGRGASTPEEAYFASESQIVLSIVEGWDLEGNAYDMDDYGNFIVISRGSLEFEGDDTEYQVLRVLTPTGLQWTAEYIADNESSAAAFNVSKLSERTIAIGPSAKNEEVVPLTGICRVSATTTQGTLLKVDISLRQSVSEEKPYVPEIPTDQPFALIPLEGDRVKIDHQNHTIEIDGFEPNCFNSFIDIPFQVYINPSFGENASVKITTTLDWPLEGRISKDRSSEYCYFEDSFISSSSGKSKGAVKKKTSGEIVAHDILCDSYISASNEEQIFLSVGAMGPDDPKIERKVNLSSSGVEIPYNIIIKPTSCIIEDVVIKDADGGYVLVQDRNIQNYDANDYHQYVCRKNDGSKYQAYNYMNIWYYKLSIPFKYKNDQNLIMYEIDHKMFMGEFFSIGKISNSVPQSKDIDNYRLQWLSKYKYSSEGMIRTSPFYEENNISNWILPTEEMLKIWQQNIKVSKLRMYLVSDIPAKSNKNLIPICCYLPYDCYSFESTDEDTYGYYFSEDEINASSMRIFSISKDGVVLRTYKVNNSHKGLVRLIRPLTEEELTNYKTDFLGYGSAGLKLHICHPDTYGHPDWLPY